MIILQLVLSYTSNSLIAINHTSYVLRLQAFYIPWEILCIYRPKLWFHYFIRLSGQFLPIFNEFERILNDFIGLIATDFVNFFFLSQRFKQCQWMCINLQCFRHTRQHVVNYTKLMLITRERVWAYIEEIEICMCKDSRLHSSVTCERELIPCIVYVYIKKKV